MLSIDATGTNGIGFSGLQISYGLDLIVVDAHLLPGPCAQSEIAELTDVTDNPQAGRLLTFEALNEGASGPFSITLPFTPGGPGTLLVCAYSVFITDDAAYASTEVQIATRSRPPVNLAPPHIVRRSDTLTCARGRWSGHGLAFGYRWLLSGAKESLPATQSVALRRGVRRLTIQCIVTARDSAGRTSVRSPVFVTLRSEGGSGRL